MKKSLLALFFIASSFAGYSQYQKASFFSSKGRTISAGSTAFIMGDGKGNPIGFFYEGGRESSRNRTFTYGTISVIPGYKFSYQTTGHSYDQTETKTVTVSGKSSLIFLYAFNVGVFLKKPAEESKFKPFVTAGFNVLLSGRVKEETTDPDGYDLDKYVRSGGFSTGFRAGAGCIYVLSDRFSLKFDAGYTFQLNISTSDYGSKAKYYDIFASHIAAGLGIRYSIFTE